MTTIEKKVTDMSIYGITGAMQFAGDVIIKNDHAITSQGKYFPTREQADAYADNLLKELA